MIQGVKELEHVSAENFVIVVYLNSNLILFTVRHGVNVEVLKRSQPFFVENEHSLAGFYIIKVEISTINILAPISGHIVNNKCVIVSIVLKKY